MKFFIDTADINEIREAKDMGLLDGVTTNPSLIAKTGRPFQDVIDEICNCDEVKAEDKIKLRYVGEESSDPRWVKKAKAKRLARKPNAQECETKESPKGGTGRKNGNGSQAGSSARPRNTRRAEMRAKRRRVPQPGDVHPSTKD